MPANKANFLVVYDNSNQVYAAASEEVALATPPPSGSTIKDKHVFFMMHNPDTKELVWYQLPDEQVHSAEIKEVKSAKKKKEQDDDDGSVHS